MRFFEPTAQYIMWIKKYAAGRPVVELGCGDGYFTSKMREACVKAMGIDPYKEGEFLDHTSFMPVRASQCRIVTDHPCLLIAARPDHSGWVTNVPFQMHEDSELLYIGLPENVDNDLVGELSFEEVEAPNIEGHVTLSIKKHEGHPPNFDPFAEIDLDMSRYVS
jgi:hypothetical protein